MGRAAARGALLPCRADRAPRKTRRAPPGPPAGPASARCCARGARATSRGKSRARRSPLSQSLWHGVRALHGRPWWRRRQRGTWVRDNAVPVLRCTCDVHGRERAGWWHNELGGDVAPVQKPSRCSLRLCYQVERRRIIAKKQPAFETQCAGSGRRAVHCKVCMGLGNAQEAFPRPLALYRQIEHHDRSLRTAGASSTWYGGRAGERHAVQQLRALATLSNM